MRTIDPLLKSACMTGSGLAIASAIITPRTVPSHAEQSFTVISYEKTGDKLSAVLKGSEVPLFGMITISRGYHLQGTDYTTALPPFQIESIDEQKDGNYKIVARAFTSYAVYDEADPWINSIYGISQYIASITGNTIDVPEHGATQSIFDATYYLSGAKTMGALELLKTVGMTPYMRIYQTENGIKLIATLSNAANITQIAIIYSVKKRIFDFPFILFFYDYGGTSYSVDTHPTLADEPENGSLKRIPINPDGKLPNFKNTMNKYYDERDGAETMFLLADMELEDGDIFSYNGELWRIEEINEKFGAEFTQSIYCHKVIEGYLLLKEDETSLLQENGYTLYLE